MTPDELLRKLEGMLRERQATLDEHFGGGKFGGSILKAEMTLLQGFVQDLMTTGMLCGAASSKKEPGSS